eukprot:5975331-Prymnesium_polylepis.2
MSFRVPILGGQARLFAKKSRVETMAGAQFTKSKNDWVKFTKDMLAGLADIMENWLEAGNGKDHANSWAHSLLHSKGTIRSKCIHRNPGCVRGWKLARCDCCTPAPPAPSTGETNDHESGGQA